MAEDLLRLVKTTLLPPLESQGFAIVDSATSNSFDNAWVVLANAATQIRIVRERGELAVAFGPKSEPDTWFDSDIVIEYLDLARDSSFDGADIPRQLRGVAKFICALSEDLQRMFDQAHITTTKLELRRLMEKRAERLFGWTPPSKRPAQDPN